MDRAPTVLHPLTCLPSLSEAAVRGLKACGVRYVEDLLRLPSDALRGLAGAAAGIGLAKLAAIIPEARFARLAGVDGLAAKRIAAAGYQSYRDLILADSGRLARAVVGPTPSIDEAQGESAAKAVQLEAARRLATATVRVIVTDARSGKPLKGVRVFVGGLDSRAHQYAERRRTGKRGSVAFDFVRPGAGPYSVIAEAEGRVREVRSIHATEGTIIYLLCALERGKSASSINEFKGDRIGLLTGAETRRLRPVSRPTALPVTTPLRISTTTVAQADGKPPLRVLVSMWRRMYGNVVETPTVAVAESSLPARWEAGMIVRRAAKGRYQAVSAAEAARLMAARRSLQAHWAPRKKSRRLGGGG